MKKLNKKGFTLVELLAVIAILAILMLLVTPNILNMFADGKKSSFITNVQSVYKSANTKFVSESLKTPGAFLFSDQTVTAPTGSTLKTLDLSTDTVDYCLVMNSAGTITKVLVSDGTYYVNLEDATGISIDDIDTSDIKDATADVVKNNCPVDAQ